MKSELTMQKPEVSVGTEEQAEQDIEGILRSLRQNIKLTQDQERSKKGATHRHREGESSSSSGIRVDTGRDAFAITDLEMQQRSAAKPRVSASRGGNDKGRLKESEVMTEAKPDLGKRTSHVKLEHFIGLLASLQFATVVLITRVRLPTADNVESFVIFSMLFITAAHAKLHALLPSNDNIQQKRDAAIFLLVVLPLYLFLALAESWFLYYLFFVYSAESFSGFGNNAQTILTIAKILGIMKIVVVCSVMFIDPVRSCIKGRRLVKS